MHIKIDIVDWTILKATAGNVDLLRLHPGILVRAEHFLIQDIIFFH